MPIDGKSTKDLFRSIEDEYVVRQVNERTFELRKESEVKNQLIPIKTYQRLIHNGEEEE